MNLAFLMIGVVAAAFSVGRLLGGPRRPPVRPVVAAAPDPARSPAG
ncbi:hypothetical protein [Blastococcus brunescens]|uniref:Uncharacterized protein n=1 Tax=Blastococcus brunescens TaxID=1564165 RepID=A0ABZ1B2E8_9ACTN|nr:hypothetical protein [Blastococcus sp. BMG 8361]WRL64919.1 hypothetical protein U6N30_04090 [Blastococcus sp. BMG 8361]